MAHPYPRHRLDLPYTGKHHYFLTFCTDRQQRLFVASPEVGLVLSQFLRAGSEAQFALTAYCFMPDHVHLIASGDAEQADVRRFIARAKQYSGFEFKRASGTRLWQRYGYERVIRDDRELAWTIGYIVANPVRAGLVSHPSGYPHLGSSVYTVADLLKMCEYDSRLTQSSG